ncbi:unnamed protein product [Thelazia callipaeda]|uniref:Carn_acyltransf domain-containing protein n=1 Tax=Thelazia callipaeda TaxID=103827 RepID=A0A0N5CZT1_THECL|nr:unnamed protein product [Thelazia callipaeda]
MTIDDILHHPKFAYRTDGYFPSSFTRSCYRFKLALIYTYLPVFLLRCALSKFYFGYKQYLFEEEGKYSRPTKLWFLFHKLFSKLSPQLNSCERLLPSLPLPSLEDTVAKYLDSIEPLLTHDDFADVKNMAENFLKNEGWKLQILARLYWLFSDNYVSDFWMKYAYHYSRKNVLINTSVAHVDVFEIIPANQAVRAAHIVLFEVLSMLSVDRELLKPVGNGLISLSHLGKVYATTRVPGEVMDHLEVHFASARHIVVFHRGCIYKVEVFDENRRMLGLAELTEIFTELLTREESVEEVESRIAALTTDSRSQWCLNRRHFFLQNPLNKQSLKIIETSIFCIVFDDIDYDSNPDYPENLEYFVKTMLVGNGCNRWADKYPEKVEEIAPLKHLSSNLKYAVRLSFDINEEMANEINRCYFDYCNQINDLDVACIVFRDFGKGLIKKIQFSPDAFIQMAIQLAMFKDQERFCLTYESASTRFFANSRTETLRTVTKESCAFVRSMVDQKCSLEERRKLLKIAQEVHVLHNKECMVGKGFDRHLFVLNILSKITGINSAFLEHYINERWELSTSQTPNITRQLDENKYVGTSWLGAAFAPLSKSGYGISYRFAGDHSICIHITSFISADNTVCCLLIYLICVKLI